MANIFSVGIDTKIVFIGAYGRVDFNHVTGFSAKPITKKITVGLLYGPPLMRYLPGGWNFTFNIERGDQSAETLQALKDLAFWTGGSVPYETMYQYIQEIDGSTSTWQYTNVVSQLEDAGKWEGENSVKQTYEGFASQRLELA